MLLLPDGLLAAGYCWLCPAGCCWGWRPGSVPPPQPGAGTGGTLGQLQSWASGTFLGMGWGWARTWGPRPGGAWRWGTGDQRCCGAMRAEAEGPRGQWKGVLGPGQGEGARGGAGRALRTALPLGAGAALRRSPAGRSPPPARAGGRTHLPLHAETAPQCLPRVSNLNLIKHQILNLLPEEGGC